MDVTTLVNPLLAVLLSPLMVGLINRTKAKFAGRTGQPLLQVYYDLWKLLRKGAVYSRTTSWVFRAGPMIGLAAVVSSMLLVPLGALPAVIAFPGDLILMAYLLGVSRFFTVLAALDTASPFEGMGASREVTFSALAEPALLLGLAAIGKYLHNFSLSGMLSSINSEVWNAAAPMLLLVAIALFVVFLAENARIPVDDPNTHLELTMIHEAMILDHGGVDFAFIVYGSSLKLWLLGAILVNILVPVRTGNMAVNLIASVAGMMVLAVVVGIIESCMARLRMIRVPQLLLGAVAFSTLAIILVLR